MEGSISGLDSLATTKVDTAAVSVAATRKEWSDKAKSLMNKGVLCAEKEITKATELFKQAQKLAEDAENTVLIGQIKRERGKLYFYSTEHKANALKYNKESGTDAGYTDVQDIKSYYYTDALLTMMHKWENSGRAISEKAVDVNIKSPDIWPNLTCIQFGVQMTGAYQQYTDNKVEAVFITQDSLNAHPGTAYGLAQKVNHKYPLMRVDDSYHVDAKIDLEIPTIDALFGTWPDWAQRLAPMIPISLGIQSTKVNASIYSNYRFFDAVNDFVADVEPKTRKTQRITVGTSFPTMKVATKKEMDDDYTKAQFFTPILGFEYARLISNSKNIYSYMAKPDKEGPDLNKWLTLQGDPGKIEGSTASIGLRYNSKRLCLDPATHSIIQNNGAHRLGVSGRIEVTNDPTLDEIYTYQTRKSPQGSIHLGADWDMVWLGKGLSTPLSFSFGWQGQKALYVNAGLGIKFNWLKFLLSYSHSTDGKDYGANELKGGLGWDFK